MKIQIIVAMTKNNIIGNNGLLPWNIKEDLKLFKEKTTGQTVIMGKNTWLSLPEKFRPLPNRNNIILSTTLSEKNNAIICNDIKDAIKKANELKKEIFCIGGARIYQTMLPLTDILHISWIKKDYLGDTFFPKMNFEEWEEKETKEYEEFVYKKYERKK